MITYLIKCFFEAAHNSNFNRFPFAGHLENISHSTDEVSISNKYRAFIIPKTLKMLKLDRHRPSLKITEIKINCM